MTDWEKEFDELDRTHGRIAWEKSIKPFIAQQRAKAIDELLETARKMAFNTGKEKIFFNDLEAIAEEMKKK